MAPFIRDGDVITVSPLRHNLSAVGEVVAFVHTDTGKLVVHRVVARHGKALIIRGDNIVEFYHDMVPSEKLIGRITRIERNGRSVWLGLGPERFIIAWFSRTGWLMPLRLWLASRLRPLIRR
jgi:hypothetical protein